MRRLALLLSCLPRQHAGFTARVYEPRPRRRLGASPICSSVPNFSSGPFATAFELPVADGLCIGLRLPSSDDADGDVALPLSELHDLEVDRLATMKLARKITFAGGRVAMRRALSTLCADGAVGCPVLPDEVGAPTLPPGTLGSISHTHGLVAAIVCVDSEGIEYAATPPREGVAAPPLRAVGVDVESATRVVSPRAAMRCLHADERATLDAAPSGLASAAGELLLRVSLKEALYKALHPLLRETIRWHSVQVHPAPAGACTVLTDELERQIGARLEAEASWQLCDGYLVTMARAALVGGATRATSVRDAASVAV